MEMVIPCAPSAHFLGRSEVMVDMLPTGRIMCAPQCLLDPPSSEGKDTAYMSQDPSPGVCGLSIHCTEHEYFPFFLVV